MILPRIYPFQNREFYQIKKLDKHLALSSVGAFNKIKYYRPMITDHRRMTK